MKKELVLILANLFLFFQACTEPQTPDSSVAPCPNASQTKTVEILTDVEGIVLNTKTLGQTNTDLFAIRCQNQKGHIFTIMLGPCNLPDLFKKDSLRVRFDANRKEVSDTQWILVEPIELTKINPLTDK